jgi:hypothetical protein
MATRSDTASRHTFLVADGIWEAHGTGWVGDDAREARISGRTEIRGLGAGAIVVESSMIVHADVPFEVRQHYDVRGTAVPERYRFVSRNDRLGELKGEISLMPDHIMLHYASAKGRFRGSEVLIRRGPDHYTAVGQFIADNHTQTMWEVELKRA